MILFHLLLLGLPAVCEAWIHASGYECPEGWIFDQDGKSCVMPFHVKRSWNQARMVCKNEGADLAVIKSLSTTRTLTFFLRRHQRYWVGIDDKDNDGNYYYIDGTKVKKYKRWDKREPSNHGGNERCVEMIGNRKGSWNDKRCNMRRFFVCQQQAVPMLECPPTWKLFEGDKICILPHTERMSWHDARTTCQDGGGDLLKLYKREISRFIEGDLSRRRRYWVGARDDDKDGEFKFVDGEKMGSFERWAHNEPNNLRGVEHCLEVIGNKRVSWNDKRCRRKRSFVCQKPADVPGNNQESLQRDESPPVVNLDFGK